MAFIDLVQPPAAEGQPVQKITAMSDQIAFAFKQPLQTFFTVAIGPAVLPCIGNYDILVKQLEESGLTVFSTLEGGQVAVNPKHVLFFTSPGLGIYMLMFPGKVGLTLKTTFQDMKQMFEGKSSIVLS